MRFPAGLVHHPTLQMVSPRTLEDWLLFVTKETIRGEYDEFSRFVRDLQVRHMFYYQLGQRLRGNG